MEFCNMKDEQFLHSDVTIATIGLSNIVNEFDLNKKGKRILEIGSREVTGPSSWRAAFSEAHYVGFDYYPGDNVDIVGDAHKLSTYFDDNEKFDLIFSSAVFEHFAMPWLVSVEISKLLKVGGIVLVETHFSFASHERPWHFFQFSDFGLRVLFSEALGFECIDAATGMGNPIVGRFSSFAHEYLRNQPIGGLYCSSSYAGKKVREVANFDWGNLDISDVVGDSKYPQPDSDDEISVMVTKFTDTEQQHLIHTLVEEMLALRGEKTEQQNVIHTLGEELSEFINSTSWKVTAPFRAISRFLKRCRK